MKIIILERQKELLVEIFSKKNYFEKKKKFFIENNLDFTNKIDLVQSKFDLPWSFNSQSSYINSMLNQFGPMFLIDFDSKLLLYQKRNNEEWFLSENGFEYKPEDIPKLELLGDMGLSFETIIDTFYEDDF